MAVAFVNSVTGFGVAASSLTLSLNVGTGSNRFVVVLAGVYTAAQTTAPTGVTYNAVSLTAGSEITVAGSGQKFRLYYGATSASNANNVVISYSNALSTVVGVCASYDGVNTAGSETIGQTTSSTPSWTLSSATGELVTALGYTFNVGQSFAATAPATTRINADIGGTRGFGMDEAGAASVTIDGTLTGSSVWVGTALSLAPTAAGGTLLKVQGIAVASVSKLNQIAYASIKSANGLTTGN